MTEALLAPCDLEASIATTVARAPGFFNGAPVVVDFEEVQGSITAEAAATSCGVVTKLGMVPVGVANLGKQSFEGLPPVLSMASPAVASLQWKAISASLILLLRKGL